ncbi:hypothetical protein BEP19_05285 [Ammoniphilus oxalaticus]|uniref:Uncharacterized protein n=1 Tax=Ammoniphilus oxalaticus TaxID=66863 RepID=A0A419SIH7_9BACL|nr:hypothetical protein [Ammoniphilus oxalaticus]RKD23844.1 hypothetical protein BEP19_05285 [Ammoniphilus oxalaticus]
MFFHGIDFKYLEQKYPFLYPDAYVTTKNEEQLADRQHLIEQFGFEPVHLLESAPGYSAKTCIKECFRFGEIVLVFKEVTEPIIQLSQHEIGARYLDIRTCQYIFTRSAKQAQIRLLGLKQPIIACSNGPRP